MPLNPVYTNLFLLILMKGDLRSLGVIEGIPSDQAYSFQNKYQVDNFLHISSDVRHDLLMW